MNKQATLNTGLDSSAMQQLDEHATEGDGDMLSTVSDDIGGIDVSSGGAHVEPKKEEGEPEAKKEEAGTEEEIAAATAAAAEAEAAKTGEPAGKEEAGKEEQKPIPFHEHPDWIRMKTERNEAVQKVTDLEARFDKLEKGEAGGVGETLLNLDDETLSEMITDEPKTFLSKLITEVRAEAKSELVGMQEEAGQAEAAKAIDKTYDEFGVEHPDFQAQWNEGKLQTFMQAHPGHTPISAYQAINSEVLRATDQERITKEVEEKVRNEYRLKIHSSVLGDGSPPAPAGELDAALNNTEKHGGLVAVQAGLIENMRKGAGVS